MEQAAEVEARRRIVVALDRFPAYERMVEALQGLTEGPIAPYIYAIKTNSVPHKYSGAKTISNLFADADVDPAVRIMADIKCRDIWPTNEDTILPYWELQPDAIVTVAMDCSLETFVECPKRFPHLKVAILGVLTDISEEECLGRWGDLPFEVMDRQMDWLFNEEIDEHGNVRARQPACAVASLKVAPQLKEKYTGIITITPGVRDEWMVDKGSQKRTTGTYEALQVTDLLVIGTQILKGYVCKDDPSQNISPQKSQELTAAEIERYLSEIAGD